MKYLEIMHGQPIASIKGLAAQFGVSDRSIRTVLREMEEETERYGRYAILGDGTLKRVNFLAFADYWSNRKLLRSRSAKKHVPPYDPLKAAKAFGFYEEEQGSRPERGTT